MKKFNNPTPFSITIYFVYEHAKFRLAMPSLPLVMSGIDGADELLNFFSKNNLCAKPILKKV